MEWARDIRCQVPWACLQSRVDAGWDAEDALSTPSGMQRIEAFGERKSLASWVRDPRCLVSEGILRKRLKQGLNAEAAIKTPPTSIFKHKKFVAFGEAKLIGDWWRDPRCCVPLQTLYSRVKAGCPFEAALTSPSRKAKPKDETR